MTINFERGVIVVDANRPGEPVAAEDLDPRMNPHSQAENDAVQLALMAMAHYDRGEWQAADDALAALREQHAHDGAFYIALAHAWRHEIEDAFTWLNRAVDEDQSVFGIRTEPFSRVLHDDPRWEPMLERLGLADHQIADIEL